MSGKNPDEIFCESCGEAIKKMAEVCPHCGVRSGSASDTVGGSGTVGSSTSGSDSPHQDGIFEFSLKYPLSNDLGPIVVGAVLTLFFWLLLPLLILYGYSFRVGRAAARGDAAIPDYDDWGTLLMNGVLNVVVFVPYAIVLTLAAAALFGIASQLDTGPVLWGLVLLGGLALLLGTYVSGAILPTFIATGSVTETYRDLRFVKVAFTKDYLVGFLVLFVLNMVVQMALSIVGTILMFTVVGIVLLIPLYLAFLPYMSYISMAVWGYVAWDTDGEGPFPRVGAQDSLDAEF